MHFYRLLVVFVLSLHAIAIAPLCNSSTIVDWHNPGGQKVRLEINGGIVPQVVSQWQLYSDNIKDSDLKTGQTLNNTVTLAGDNLAGSADLPGGSNGGFFYTFPSPPSWSGGGGWLPLERIALKTHLTVGIKAGNDGGKPSGKVPDEESKDENNDHQKEQRDEPGGQESRSTGEWNDGSGNNRKDDNGGDNEKNTMTQDLQDLANQLIAIIECGDPNAVFMLRKILDVLDMPQRLQVLETTGTNARGNPVTPLEAILELQRSVKENSLRNRFIKQLIEATSDKTRTLDDPDILSSLQPIIPPARALPEAGVNNLRILYKIVQDIIRRINQSDQQTLIGQFEKYCFIEYFLQLFLLYSNPLEPIRELLGKISDSVISRDIVIHAQTLTLPISFRDAFIELEQHPSRHESAHLSNELIRRTHTFHSLQEPSLQVPLIVPVISHSDNTANAKTVSNAIRFTDSIRQVNGSHSASGSGGCSPDLPTDRYLQQGARPKQRALANQQNASSQKQLKEGSLYGDHQTDGAQDQCLSAASVINQRLLSKHSGDGSLLVKLERCTQEKKRQKIEELTEEVEGLRINNRALTLEAQGLRIENRDLANMNQNLMAESLRHRDLLSDSETTNQCLREHITKLSADLISRQRVIDYLIHQAAENVAQRITAANSPAIHSNDTARFASHQELGAHNEQADSSIDHSELPSVTTRTHGEEQQVPETNPTIPGSGSEYRACHQQSNIHNEEATPSNEPLKASEQEAREPLCNHYHRLCRVSFECCAGYFPCHKCHNANDNCEVSDRMACEARKLQCSLCQYEGDITENSQTCPECNALMSEYYCAKCKQFTNMEKNPYHCDQCGICRTGRDKSFHCDVCNVCLEVKFQGNHKCRENSGHDECCICLEDVFDDCQILPCSHKVHGNCRIAMTRNRIRACPVCRYPL